MSKIVIEYTTEELKAVLAEILAERVTKVLPRDVYMDIARKATQMAQQSLADKIEKELGRA